MTGDMIITEIGRIKNNVDRLLAFIAEREKIRIKRTKNSAWPYTDDPILQTYSFCNVRREEDRITKWIAKNWRRPCAGEPDLWFAMVVARLVNQPDTLADLGFPVPWDPKWFLEIMAAPGKKRYGGAYMIHADNKTGRPTPIYQVEALFDPLWARRDKIRPRPGDTLADFDDILRELQHRNIIEGLGSFYIGQIIADLKYVEPLKSAKDWWTYCVPGPGSERGLNRILGRRPVDARWDERAWRRELLALHADIAPNLEEIGIGRLCAQDIQNCLCEFDKYERVRLGEGKPKKKYRPPQDAMWK